MSLRINILVIISNIYKPIRAIFRKNYIRIFIELHSLLWQFVRTYRSQRLDPAVREYRFANKNSSPCEGSSDRHHRQVSAQGVLLMRI